MIASAFLAVFLLSSCWAAEEEIPFVGAKSDEEIPFVIRGQPEEQKVSSLLPDEPDVPPLVGASRGRSDIEVEDDQLPSGGYFYPKPAKPFNLPEFKTLDATLTLDGAAYAAEENGQLERQRRSPQRRRRPYFPSPPPFIPGFIPPNNIRPLPALYGRPGRF